MGFLKVIFIIAITMALSITLTMKIITSEDEANSEATSSGNNNNIHNIPSQPLFQHEKNILLPSKRVSRLLAQNPNAPIHCHKDNEICDLFGAKNATCCNNKCLDLAHDKHNCGACKKHCKYTQTCCRGQCVDTNFDKRHCGACNYKCEEGQYCVYGMCGYA